MKTNTMLTYLLYALLTGLIVVAGYKACQMKNEEARLAQESKEEAFQKQLRDMGYLEEDTTGSQYGGDENTDQPVTTPATDDKSTVTTDGIEDEAPVSTTTTPKTRPVTSPPAETTAKGSDPKPADRVDNSVAKPRYYISAGSFTKLASARRQMEKMIQMGYENAEIGYTNGGKFAVVVVKRTNSLSEANKILDKLEAKGIDVNVVDRLRK